jgi:UDP-glucose 4-epimerase
MNILVLGAKGFIGSHVLERLSNSEHFIKAFIRSGEINVSNCTVIRGDFSDHNKLAEALVDVDMVIHCISSTVPSSSELDPISDVESNLVNTLGLLQLMQKMKVPKLIYLSSGGTVYGNPLQSPVPEDHPLNPISCYGVVKVSIEKFLSISESMWGVSTLILRPSNVFGEGQSHAGAQGIISTLLKNSIQERDTTIFGDGESIRDYLYVKDLADLVAACLDFNKSAVYNAGCGVGLSVNQIISTVRGIYPGEVGVTYIPKRSFDVKEIVLDISKVTDDFSWTPYRDFKESVNAQYLQLRETLSGRSTR